MQLDIEDIFASALGRVAAFCVFMVSAIWAGSFLGGIAMLVSNFVSSGLSFSSPAVNPAFLWYSPVLLFNLWLVPNVGFIGMSIVYLLVSDRTGYRAWGIIFGIESLFAMLGWTGRPGGSAWIAWLAWAVLLAMTETGVWVVHALRRNHFVHELAALKAENALRHAERRAARENAESPADGNLN